MFGTIRQRELLGAYKEKLGNLWKPFEYSLSTEHVGRSPHEEADMESSLSNTPPVLHIPAVLSVEVRMSVWSVSLSQTSQQITVLKLETEGSITQSLDHIKLLGLGSVSVPVSRKSE